MKPHLYKDEGIILSRKTYSEADRILTIFTKQNGKVTVMAKGVRKLTSRKRGHIENFSYIRFSATSGQNSMSVITETETVDNFENIRKDLSKIAVAYFLLETVNKITHEAESFSEVFDLLLTYLKKLQTATRLKELRTNFTQDILIMLGFWDEGQSTLNSDQALENILERHLSSIRIGKKLIN
ncbi:MAG: DNA repair protein RecO [Patescibacteria group bacterium]